MEVAKHQRLHLEVEGLREEVRAGDERVQECAKRLTRADASLSGPLKVAKKLLEAGKKAEEGALVTAHWPTTGVLLQQRIPQRLFFHWQLLS